MARKNLLQGLLGDSVSVPAENAVSPRMARGAIGAISRSVAELQARALMEIDAELIDAGGVHDRLEADPAEDAALQASIAEYGQQVPVLVRPHPEAEGRYQIVYGRRRVAALRALKQPVKALIRQLDDRDLVIAQGQENTARRELSFIEKASFARQMTRAGYDRKTVGDTLAMDKTLVSRVLSVADRVPEGLIAAIGAAPSVGRERWLALAEALDPDGVGLEAVMAAAEATEGPSDLRFEAALRAAKPKTPREQGAAEQILSTTGMPLAEVTRPGGRLTLKFDQRVPRGFEDWLVQNLADLHRRWGSGG